MKYDGRKIFYSKHFTVKLKQRTHWKYIAKMFLYIFSGYEQTNKLIASELQEKRTEMFSRIFILIK